MVGTRHRGVTAAVRSPPRPAMPGFVPRPEGASAPPGAGWRLRQPSQILPASLEWKITASNFAEGSRCQHFN